MNRPWPGPIPEELHKVSSISSISAVYITMPPGICIIWHILSSTAADASYHSRAPATAGATSLNYSSLQY